jgi:hypothetical protein
MISNYFDSNNNFYLCSCEHYFQKTFSLDSQYGKPRKKYAQSRWGAIPRTAPVLSP